MCEDRYTHLELPTEIVRELSLWRTAFCRSYGRDVSYGEMIRGMLDSLSETEPGVVEEFDKLQL